MLRPNFVSAAEILAAIASRVEVDVSSLERSLDLPPEKVRILGREVDRYGPMGRGGFLNLFVNLVKRSKAADELEAVFHNASGTKNPLPWFYKARSSAPRHALTAGPEVQKLLRAIADEVDEAVLAYRRGDLAPGFSFQRTGPDTSALQWIGSDRDALVALLDEAKVPHSFEKQGAGHSGSITEQPPAQSLAGVAPGSGTPPCEPSADSRPEGLEAADHDGHDAAPIVASRIHLQSLHAPGTFEHLLDKEYARARAQVTGEPVTGFIVNAMWASLLEACSRDDSKPKDVQLYESGPYLKVQGKSLKQFDKETLRKRVARRLEKERQGD